MYNDDDILVISNFFATHNSFIESSDLFIYKNYEKFIDLLENYISQNSLESNQLIKSFLCDLKFEQLVYKQKNLGNKSMNHGNEYFLNIINRWQEKCNFSQDNSLVEKLSLN